MTLYRIGIIFFLLVYQFKNKASYYSNQLYFSHLSHTTTTLLCQFLYIIKLQRYNIFFKIIKKIQLSSITMLSPITGKDSGIQIVFIGI